MYDIFGNKVKTVDLGIKSQNNLIKCKFKVEIAESEASRLLGLMYRKKLPKNNGMFFFMSDNDRPLQIWMKNTLIALDVIFINKDLDIVNIVYNTKPLSLDIISSNHPASYVLEINAGLSKKYKINNADKIFINLN
jgi:uncharacterized membrane protein (UPF0127 family)